MGLLKSVSDVPGIDFHDYRDSSYYSKYLYRLRLSIPGVRYAWYSDIETLKLRLAGKSKLYSKLRDDAKKEITENLVPIERLITFRAAAKKDKNIGLRSEGDTIAVFSNDLQYLQDIKSQYTNDVNVVTDMTEVITSNLVGIKHFVNKPKFNYRVYLKSKRAPDGFKEELKKFLDKNKKTLSSSPAMSKWVREKTVINYWWGNYMSSHYFIDYNEESTLSYLALLYGDMLGKRYKLEKRPEPT